MAGALESEQGSCFYSRPLRLYPLSSAVLFKDSLTRYRANLGVEKWEALDGALEGFHLV